MEPRKEEAIVSLIPTAIALKDQQTGRTVLQVEATSIDGVPKTFISFSNRQ